jgi:hypothetical protein
VEEMDALVKADDWPCVDRITQRAQTMAGDDHIITRFLFGWGFVGEKDERKIKL